jgi:hypothetical protein
MLKTADNTTKTDDVPTTTIPVPMMCCLMLFILFPVVVVVMNVVFMSKVYIILYTSIYIKYIVYL